MYISETTVQDTGKTNELNIWYSRDKICSYNGLFNFCLGARGTGKTFDFKRWALSYPKPFVWVRRTDEDLKKLTADNAREFTKDLYLEGFLDPKDKCKMDGGCLFMNEIPQIYFIPLSLADRYKSLSYADVDIMVFDETFERNPSKYLKNEVSTFFELYETIGRLRLDGRPEVRVFFLSNNISFTNPYFSYFGIKPFQERIKTFYNGTIVVENYKNEEFVKLKKQTRFGKLIAQTKYGKYSIDNEIWMDDNALLDKRPKDSIPIMEIRTGEKYISVWNGKNGLLYAENGHCGGRKYSLKYECLDGELPLALGKYPLKELVAVFYAGKLRFDNNITKSIMYELFQSGGKS